MLKWHASNDPDQMYEMMRANIYLTMGIGPTVLSDLLQLASAGQPRPKLLQGWDSFWRGYTFLATDVQKATSPFHLAASIGIERGDHVLATESLMWAGYASILRGRRQEAKRLAEIGSHLTSGISDKVLQARMRNLSGTADLHMGRTKEAVEQLLLSCDALESNTMEWAQSMALCGLYCACDGRSIEAERLLAAPRQIAESSCHMRLMMICELADAHLHLTAGNFADASRSFRRLDGVAAEAKAAHFEIYGREGLAVTLWQKGERAEAISHLNASRQLRRVAFMPYSNWDQQRLSSFPSALRLGSPR